MGANTIVGKPIRKAFSYVGGLLAPSGTSNVETPDDPGPTLSDEAIKNAKLAERRRNLGLQGRSGTFLTGPFGDASTPKTKTPTLLGGG